MSHYVEELKRVIEKLRSKGFKDSDIMAVTHLTETNLMLLDTGHGNRIPSIPLKQALANYLGFERRAKLFMKGES